jgi:hypothetical protein
MATSVAGGLVLGYFVDKRELTLPLFTFVGLAVGIVVASLYAYFKFRKFWS